MQIKAKKILMIILSAFFLISASAQSSDAWICIPTRIVGFSNDRGTSVWSSLIATQRDRRYILSQQSLNSVNNLRQHFGGSPLDRGVHPGWKISQSGFQSPFITCSTDFLHNQLDCNGDYEFFFFNRETLRFQLYARGTYTSGDNPPNNFVDPVTIEIGTCSYL